MHLGGNRRWVPLINSRLHEVCISFQISRRVSGLAASTIRSQRNCLFQLNSLNDTLIVFSSMCELIPCTQTLFYFSFRSFRKHRRARKRKKSIFFFPCPYPLGLRSINSPRFLFCITLVRRTLRR